MRKVPKKSFVLLCILFFPLAVMTASQAWGAPLLVDWAFNDSGSIFTADDTDIGDLPDHFSTGDFDWETGLGSLNISFQESGNYSFMAFFDHEIVQADNTYFNEYGEVHGTAASGQTWEIDEPGWIFGDIYDHVLDGRLDNSNALPWGLEDDVSMAMGWDFSLMDGESALLSFTLSESVPAGFYLAHHDPVGTLYLSGSLDITATPAPVPEPGTLVLFISGLAGLAGLRRKLSFNY